MYPCQSLLLYTRKFSLLDKEIGFLRLYFCRSPTHSFSQFFRQCCHVALPNLNAEGQVLCLTKHNFTENRELAPPKLRLKFQPCAPVEIQGSSLHHLKCCANIPNCTTDMAWPPMMFLCRVTVIVRILWTSIYIAGPRWSLIVHWILLQLDMKTRCSC